MKFSANKDGVEQFDGLFRVQLQKKPKYLHNKNILEFPFN